MLLLLELLFSVIRIIILLLGVLLTIILGNDIYSAINQFLLSLNFPCVGLISFLVIFVPAFSLLYGAHIRRFFWQRERKYNAIILGVSFVVGAIISFLPVDAAFTMSQSANLNCNANHSLNAQLIHMFGTAILTTLLAAIGMDLGVVLKHASHHVKHRLSTTKVKRTRTRTKKRKRK